MFVRCFQYKYQLNIDGTVAAYRYPYLLAGDSVVFKQESRFYEHFYQQLVPMEHYIPVKADLSDLVDQLNWARSHDETVRRISRAARKFVNDNLLPSQILCYYVRLIEVDISSSGQSAIEYFFMQKIPLFIGMEQKNCERYHCASQYGASDR